jgi:S-adenosylmethionine hydrolase
MRPIVLLTDFGMSDPFVGQMHGVLARLAPAARVLDLSHGVEPFNVLQAAFYLTASAPHFPDDAVFVAVVDPGVGSDRRIAGLEIGHAVCLAPDNGLPSLLASHPGNAGRLGAVCDLTPDIKPARATFHGRDVFAPLAARLAGGQRLADLGPALDPDALVPSEWPRPAEQGGEVRATVLHVDRFGNATLNLDESWVEKLGRDKSLEFYTEEGSQGLGLTDHFAGLAPGQPGLVKGSQGWLELAVYLDSAADVLGVGPGDELVLTWKTG